MREGVVEQACVDRALGRPAHRLRFEPEIERMFDAATVDNRLWHCRLHLCVLFAILIAVLPLDEHSGILRESFAIRSCILGPLFALGLCLTSPRRSAAVQGWGIAVPVVATVLALTWSSQLDANLHPDRYVMAAGLIAFSTNLVMPLRFRHAALVSAANIAGYLGLILLGLPGPHAPEMALDIVLLMTGLTLVTLHIAFHNEKNSRNTFLVALRSSLQSRELVELNARLEHLSSMDPLTGIPNRRSFALALDRLWSARDSLRPDLGLLMIDVDHFKKFNDAAGHAEGDSCLQRVASAISGQVGRENVVARIGGEEFAVLLPSADSLQTRQAGETIRSCVEELGLRHPGLDAGQVVSVSVGGATATWEDREAGTSGSIMRRADEALYEAKRRGRNRVVVQGADDVSVLADVFGLGAHGPQIVASAS